MALSTKDFQKLIKEAMKAIITDQCFMESLVKSVSEHLNEKIDEVLTKQQEKLKEVEEKVTALSKENSVLKLKLEKQEQYHVKNCIRIYGVEESEDEVTDDIVHNLMNKTLKIKINVAQNTEFSYRVGPKTAKTSNAANKKPRAILVRFCNYRDKLKVIESRKNLKSSGVVIREELTKVKSELLRTAINKYSSKNVWTWNGEVFANIDGQKRKLTCGNEMI
ncbi:unnamed protein product [Phaedon cochleariae]|uniref:Uncharacterized protein n=1 Tax=Phaedon cochleariae TaxID=80249 RepID=A0A9N9S859_PHACE|nr:unnamed protein product [Phaedon cochleariae]